MASAYRDWSYKEKEGQTFLKLLYDNPEIPVAVDTETTGLNVTLDDHLIGVSMAFIHEGKGYSHYFGFRHETGVNCGKDTLRMLKGVLLQDRVIVFANALFDMLSLLTVGIDTRQSNFIDICTMAHLINENRPFNKGVDSLAKHYLGEDEGKIEDDFVEAEKKTGNRHITPEQMWDYAVVDAELTYRIWDVLRFHKNWLELPEEVWSWKQRLIAGPLLAMKQRGVRVNVELCKAEIIKGEAEMKRLAAELGFPAKPTKKNPDPLPTLGPIALEEIFLKRLKLPVVKRGKPSKRNPDGNPSFDKTVMEEYDLLLERIDSPEAKLVKAYRGWQKAVSASYKAYLRFLDDDGRVRCSYKTHGTVTGRFSCSEPNLQQIPKSSDKEWNGKVKQAFVAEEGYVLINADFSQLELRLATAYADIPELKQVFEEDRDIFTEMSGTLGFSRNDTKTFVYSTQYGAGPPRIMSAFGVTYKEATQMIRHYYKTYPGFRVLAERCRTKAERELEVVIWTGRKRHFLYKSDSYKAMNSVIQGGAADIVERIMVRVFDVIDNDDCRMLLQVHDSITFEVKAEKVEEYMKRIKAVMEDVDAIAPETNFDVKFAVDVDYWTPELELAA